MSNGDLQGPPGPNNGSSKGGAQNGGGGDQILNVNNLHLHPNDYDALARLAAVDPALAREAMAERERQRIREEGSFRFGLLMALIFMTVIILGVVYVAVNAGILSLFFTIGIILAAALFVRVIITGEWSETNWMGHLVKGLVSFLGGKDAKDEKE